MPVFSRITFVAFALTLASIAARANPKDCAAPGRWTATIAEQRLVEIGKLKRVAIDRSQTKVTLLASEKLKGALFHQIQKIDFFEKGGTSVSVIAENDATNQECSGSDVTVYVVEKTLRP